MKAALPTQIGHYLVHAAVEGGGMGTVYAATDLRLGRTVALKHLRALGQSGLDQAAIREALALAKLSHPGIVKLFELVESEGRSCLVMEWIAGRSLASCLDAGRLPPRRALAILDDVAQALAYAHGRGIVHGDLSPQNVMLDEHGKARLIDFGLARIAGASGDALTSAWGSPAYFAPERWRGNEASIASDLWAFGALAFHMLGGSPAFSGADVESLRRSILAQDGEFCSRLPDEVPECLRGLVRDLLRANPADRPADAVAVLDVLAEAGAAMAPHAGLTKPSDTAKLVEVRPRRRPLASLLAVLVVALGVIIWTQYVNDSGSRIETVFPVESPRIMVRLVQGDDSPIDTETGVGLALAAEQSLIGVSGVRLLDAASRWHPFRGLDGLESEAVDEYLDLVVLTDPSSLGIIMRRLDARIGRVLTQRHFKVPRDDARLRLAVEAVSLHAREMFGADFDGVASVSADDYRAFVRIYQLAASGAGERRTLLDELSGLLERQPAFSPAALLAVNLATDLLSAHPDARIERDAQQWLDQLQRTHLDTPALLIRKVRFAAATGNHADASWNVERLRMRYPDNAEAFEAESRLAELEGRTSDAVEAMLEAVQRSPGWHYKLRLARLALRDGRVDLARQTTTALVALEPDHPRALSQVAMLELLGGDARHAALLYARLAERTGHRSHWNNLALAQYLNGDLQDARASLGRALELGPDRVLTRLNLAEVSLALGDHAGAMAGYTGIRDLLRAREDALQPNERMLLAQSLAQLGECPEAIRETVEASAPRPRDGELALQAVSVFAACGERATATATAERALALGVAPRWLVTPLLAPMCDFEPWRRMLAARGTGSCPEWSGT